MCGTRVSSNGYDLIISKSTDSGLNWTRCNLGSFSGSASVLRLAIAPSNMNVVYAVCSAESSYRLMKSTNGGTSWSNTNMTGYSGSAYDMLVDKTNPNKVMIASEDGFFCSTDGGRRFSKIHSSAVYHIANSKTLNGIAISSKNGLWVWKNSAGTPVFFGSHPCVKNITCTLDSGDDYIWAGTAGNSVWRSNCGTSINDEPSVELPKNTLTVHPNPVTSGSTMLSFEVAQPGQQTITVVDISGRTVSQLYSDHMNAGRQQLQINTENLTSGLYFAVITGNNNSLFCRFVVTE